MVYTEAHFRPSLSFANAIPERDKLAKAFRAERKTSSDKYMQLERNSRIHSRCIFASPHLYRPWAGIVVSELAGKQQNLTRNACTFGTTGTSFRG